MDWRRHNGRRLFHVAHQAHTRIQNGLAYLCPVTQKPFSRGITIIGAGNVGSHLSAAFFTQGFIINQVFSRTLEKAEGVAKSVKADAVNDISKLRDNSDLYILAVKDSAIREIANELRMKGLVVHTSGTASMDELSRISERTGVFYPLQTFTKGRPLNWNDIPVCIEANNQNDLSQLHQLASSLSNKVIELNSEKRKQLHLAAVFVNNFTNLLLDTASDIMQQAGLDFLLMHALASETVEKAFTLSPEKAQTGPALRNDINTIDEHLKMLSKPLQKEIYALLSKAIQGKR
jgi:predicted short-subunit dehydrogenase-like oxidoreductase (DUF2520 family)